MLNTAPSRSLARRSRQLLLLAFISSAVGIFVTAIGLFLFFVPFAAQGTTGDQTQRILSMILIIAGILTFLTGLALAFRAITRRRENDLALITGEHLSHYLDERYRFIRNINQPGLGYIDAVLVGPPGILVFRILDETGEFLNEKSGWVRKNKQGEWVPFRINPTEEAIVDVKAIKTFLEKHQIKQPDVYGVVVFITNAPQTTFRVQSPVIPVTHLPDLLDTLKNNYLAMERINPKTVAKIGKLLLGERL